MLSSQGLCFHLQGRYKSRERWWEKVAFWSAHLPTRASLLGWVRYTGEGSLWNSCVRLRRSFCGAATLFAKAVKWKTFKPIYFTAMGSHKCKPTSSTALGSQKCSDTARWRTLNTRWGSAAKYLFFHVEELTGKTVKEQHSMTSVEFMTCPLITLTSKSVHAL